MNADKYKYGWLVKTIQVARKMREYEQERYKRMRETPQEEVEQWEQDTCPMKEVDE